MQVLNCFRFCVRTFGRKVVLCNYQFWESLLKNLEQWQHTGLPCSRGTFQIFCLTVSVTHTHLPSNTSERDITINWNRAIRSLLKNKQQPCVSIYVYVWVFDVSLCLWLYWVCVSSGCICVWCLHLVGRGGGLFTK